VPRLVERGERTQLGWIGMSLLNVARGRRETAPDVVEPIDVPWEDGLVPIELYTVDGRQWGWIRSGGERTSDWLNHADSIHLFGLTDLPLDREAAAPGMPDEGMPATDRPASDVVLAVPPALPPNRHLRLHRRIEEVRMELANFALVGRVHIRPGAQAGDHLLRGSRRFVPVTRVQLTYTGETTFRRQLPVVIVNVSHITMLNRGESPAEAETAAPSAEPAVGEGASGIEQTTFVSVRAALEQLAELASSDLITDAEHRRKRAEILARL
jgi:hypothetical protein